MGLFSWAWAWDWVCDRVDDAKDWVSEKVEAVKDFFGLGRSASYDGSISQTVNIEKVLNTFKGELNAKIEEQEKACISLAVKLFDELIEELKDDFYDSVTEAERKKDQAINGLLGIMSSHAQKLISENDPQFQAVLKMQPGSAKEEQLKKRTEEILSGAEAVFYEQLEKEIQLLNDDLTKSLEESLAEQSSQISAEKKQLEELEQSASTGTLDLKAHEMKTEPTIEPADYLLLLLSENT